MSKNILIIIGLFILSACSNNLTDKFSSDFIDETEVCFTPSELIKSDILCRYPIRLEILDSVFVVQDLGGSEYLQVYDRRVYRLFSEKRRCSHGDSKFNRFIYYHFG